MDFGMCADKAALLVRVCEMVRTQIMPRETEFHAEIDKGGRWSYTARQTEILEGLKHEARAWG